MNKSDLRIALDTYFRVGQLGGKTLDHFDELMQALDEDQAEEKFEHKKLFEEDREFNQGVPTSFKYQFTYLAGALVLQSIYAVGCQVVNLSRALHKIDCFLCYR